MKSISCTVSGIFTCLNVLAAVHIGWLSKQNKTVNKWEVRIVRISLILFQQIFFMSVLNFFLVPLSSDYWGTIYTKGALLYFPDKKISAYLPHAGIGLFFAALHITASFVTHFRYLDVNVIGNNTLCMFDGRHIARTYAAKVLIALISHLMPGYRRELATFIMMALYGYLAKIHVMSFPFAYLKQQYIYAAWHTMVFFWSIVLFAKEAQTVRGQYNNSLSSRSLCAILSLFLKLIFSPNIHRDLLTFPKTSPHPNPPHTHSISTT